MNNVNTMLACYLFELLTDRANALRFGLPCSDIEEKIKVTYTYYTIYKYKDDCTLTDTFICTIEDYANKFDPDYPTCSVESTSCGITADLVLDEQCSANISIQLL